MIDAVYGISVATNFVTVNMVLRYLKNDLFSVGYTSNLEVEADET